MRSSSWIRRQSRKIFPQKAQRTQNLSILGVIRDLRGGQFTPMAHISRLYEVWRNQITPYAIRNIL